MSDGSLDPAALIPHRPPILCVDALVAVGADAARGSYVVRDGPLAVDGALWELACIEGLAQTAAAIEGRADRDAATGSKTGMLIGIRAFRTWRVARIGEHVSWEVAIATRFGPFMLAKGRVLSGEELIAEGELKFYVGPGRET